MESRLPIPKASMSKKPLMQPAKNILPMDRLGLKTLKLNPLANQSAISHSSTLFNERAASPDLAKTNFNNRIKLRRSKSVSDFREITRPLKRTESVLGPIPSKITRKENILSNNLAKRNALLTTRSNLVAQKSSTDGNIIKRKEMPPTTAATSGKIISRRIPPYDYKARFNDLVEKHKVLKEKNEQLREKLILVENMPEQFEESQDLLSQAREELKNAKVDIECFERQTNMQTSKIATLNKCLEETQEKHATLLESYEKLSSEHSIITKEVFELRENFNNVSEKNTAILKELEETKEQLFRANIERKDLHNAVMDLRGNIRVFCRVRPPLESEEDRMLCGWSYIDETTLEISNLEILASGVKNKVGSHSFSFDHVFHTKSKQDDVFEMVSPLIQSALDGYNICIFAYGQTGSGKTYTMDGIPSNVGVIPRTVDLLFESIKNYKRLGWSYTIKVTFLEIYNEVLYDLLSNEQKEMEIRMAKNKSDIYVSNITEENVENANHLRHLMQIAKMNRATASTIGNERSSRSHAVTRIELIGTHEEKSETSIGTINLVDLAGSESPKTSIRMNETKSINRSLSELTNVILAILQKQDHIPYRNSKLTHLLMPSLGGNSKTLMFINVSPFQDCFVESVKSLRFAASVNSCKLSKVKKNKFLNTSASFS